LSDRFHIHNDLKWDILRRMGWAGHMTHMRDRRGAYNILVGRPEGKQPLGRPRRRWEDKIKMDLQEVGWGHGVDMSGKGEGQAVGCCECGNDLLHSIKCREFLD
jgi:hypothetical protein